MKQVTKDELIRQLMAENAALKSQSGNTAAALDYLAMMSDISIPTEEVTEDE